MTQVSRRGFIGAGAAGLAFASSVAQAAPQKILSDIDAATLHRSKATQLGLYLSPTAAHKALQQNPDILFVDVRDPIEITFVGHPEGLDKIIPLLTATHDLNPQTGQYNMALNRSFMSDFEALLHTQGKTKSDPIFLTCRSGSRSAGAAKSLIKSGYTNVWNLTEGFEGDRNAGGARLVNGWRNAGLPWGYHLAPGVAWTT